MDLSTLYMGLKLRNPVIVSSSKLTSNVENIVKCAEHGAAAVVMKSLFEEQLLADPDSLIDMDHKYFWYPEAVEYINEHSRSYGVKEYIDLLTAAKENTDIPIIASINCTTPNEWPKFARKLEDAGADGIELNIAIIPMVGNVSSKEIEDTYIEIIKEVKKNTTLPIAVKFGPLFTNPFNIIQRMDKAGADALVIFNRFYRPDINVETETIVHNNILSSPVEMTQSLRWVSLLSDKVKCDVAANTGIHDAEGLIKQLLAGADAAQICSTLYSNGIGYIETILQGLEDWMARHQYSSIGDFKGKFARDNEHAVAFARVQFMKRNF
ncbi:MAG TPA: dihydroorotate dehydrogenase-like protein [Bacteroidales bacterium]|nr:dihydroorotate dehydrogenase-like protein [Bacteroidales bacterium]